MPELLCYLRDGACCTLVLIHAPARNVAETLGRAVTPAEATLGLAADIGSGWTRVELKPAAELNLDHEALQGYEAILLLREALPITRGQLPQSPPCFETPVSTAAMLSARLNANALAVWASDQGPGVGGLAQLANGQPTAVLSATDPDRLESLLQGHLSELDGEAEADDDDVDAADDVQDDERYFLWPEQAYADGAFDEAADARLESLGLDLEFLGDPLWSLVEGDEPHESLGECFGIA